MELITKKYFQSFLSEMEILGGENERNFEKFVNYSILFPKNIVGFDLASISTGDGGDCAIDGLAIVLNNKFVSNLSQLEDILRTGMEFSVEFYFIQAKTSDKFEGKEMLQFGNGVLDVLNVSNNSISKVKNIKIKEKCKMIELLIENYDLFKDVPKCYLYYVTTGLWVDDTNLLVDVNKVKDDLIKLEIFEQNIEFYTYGSKELRKQYKLTKEQNSATFDLEKKIDLPYMEGVEESFLAILPINEYLNIIVDEQGKIKKGIFELNVRDFNGIENNRVNQDIINTIQSKERVYFGLLNNGVTLVGKSSSKTKGKYTIKNFYIVNGCQTSNILHQSINDIDQNMWVSVKIVITDREDIIKNIVKATNNQTEVQEIQLLSMSEYQELLEQFYNSFEVFKLYYERRSGQYNSNNNIDKSRIVTPEMQIRAFASVILDYPHIASRYYGNLLEDIGLDDIGRGIFVTGQLPILYYTSALLLVSIDNSFNNDLINNKYYKFKYHLLFVISKLVWKEKQRPPLNSKKIEEYCNTLIDQLLDKDSYNQLLEKAKFIIDKVIINLDDLEANKSASVVSSLLMYIELEVTHSGLRSMISFVDAMENIYLVPFHNMKIDGDLRYNFIDRLQELVSKIKVYKFKSIAENLESYYTKVDYDSRESRRINASEIYTYIDKICRNIKTKIELSKKFTSNRTEAKQSVIVND